MRSVATIAIFFLGILSSMGAVVGLHVKATVDSTVITMGDKIHLRVTVDMPAENAAAVSLSELPLLTSGQEYLPWNGVDIVASDTTGSINNGRRHIEYDYVIQAFDPGTITLPPFAVVTAGLDTAKSDVVSLKVLPVEIDSLKELNPMASIVSPATKWYDYIPDWLLWTLLAVTLVVGGIIAFIQLRKHKEEINELRNPPIPPYELAKNRLTALRTSGLAENGHEKEYYTELTDILRQYLHGRFNINAMEMTSTQIVKALRSNPDTRMTADQMRAVLSIADFVKFAKVRPLPDDNVRAFSKAQDFVENTKPAPEPEVDVDANKKI